MTRTRSILTAVIILACTPLYVTSKGTKKVSQKEYTQLIVQCRAIRDRILRENSFEAIKQQAISRYNTQTVPMLAEQFNAMGAGRSSAFNSALRSSGMALNQNLLAMEAQHNLQVVTLIAKTIASYLQTLSTPASMKLLADLIAKHQVL